MHGDTLSLYLSLFISSPLAIDSFRYWTLRTASVVEVAGETSTALSIGNANGLTFGVAEPALPERAKTNNPFAFYNPDVRRRFHELLLSVGVQPRVPYRAKGAAPEAALGRP